LDRSIYTIKKKAKALLVANEKVGLGANAENIKHMVTSQEQNAVKNLNIKMNFQFFESVEQIKYLGTTLKCQHSIQGDIKSRLKSGNVCYLSVQNLWSSSLLSKNIKIKI
jgi:hypothetical protein